MTMHVNLSPEMERYIKDKVSSGFYGSATEVIRDAIRRMQADEERALAVSGPAGAEEAGEYSAKRLEELAQAARQKLRRGERVG